MAALLRSAAPLNAAVGHAVEPEYLEADRPAVAALVVAAAGAGAVGAGAAVEAEVVASSAACSIGEARQRQLYAPQTRNARKLTLMAC